MKTITKNKLTDPILSIDRHNFLEDLFLIFNIRPPTIPTRRVIKKINKKIVEIKCGITSLRLIAQNGWNTVLIITE